VLSISFLPYLSVENLNQAIKRRLDEVQQNLGTNSSGPGFDVGRGDENVGLEVEYLSLLGSSVTRCVEELLVTCVRSLSVVGRSKENVYHGSNRDNKNPIRGHQLQLVLEQSGLESKVSLLRCGLVQKWQHQLTHNESVVFSRRISVSWRTCQTAPSEWNSSGVSPRKFESFLPSRFFPSSLSLCLVVP